MNRYLSITARTVLVLAAAGCSARTGTRSVPAPGFPEADSVTEALLAPGVVHTRLWLDEGPWAVHVVAVDLARCRPVWSVRKPAGTLETRGTTTSLTADAMAGINADFFQTPGGTPVGAQVTAGVPVIGPSTRAVWLWRDGSMYAGPAVLRGVVRAGRDSLALTQVNRVAVRTSAYQPPADGVTLFTTRVSRIPPGAASVDVVLLRRVDGDERAGSGVVMRVARAQRDTLVLQPGEVALQVVGSARAWAARRNAGDTVAWHSQVSPPSANWAATEAVGGFPLLLRSGADVLAETATVATFGPARHPRSALGWNDHTVYLVLVDGRQPPYSAGMSLAELTWVFQRLGATDAINLDGGGSSALVVRGKLANRPSDAAGERAVGNALALERCQR